jgi:hypothetical protein
MLIYTRHDPRFFDRRLHKGGDGGSAQMRSDELARQGKVQQAVDAINTKFGKGGQTLLDPNAYLAANPDVAAAVQAGKFTSAQDHYDQYGRNENRQGGIGEDPSAATNATAREGMYSDISSAVRDQAMRDLDQQYTTASNRNTFGLARSGLMGGSVDAESGADLSRRYGEGEMKAEQAGLGAASDLRTQDEKTRQNLIGLAQSGLDTGTAASMASGQMAAAADSAKANAAGSSVGRLFDDLSQAYVNNQYMRTRYPTGMPMMPMAGGYGGSGYGYGSGAMTSNYSGNVQR